MRALVLALACSSCALLPDGAYVETGQTPYPTDAPGWSGEELVTTVGLRWALKPTRVVVVGQEERHPWDLAAATGIYSPDDKEPDPLIVVDPNTRKLREGFEQMADEWDALNTTLLAGGGLPALVLLLVYGRRAVRRRAQPETQTND